MTDEPPRDGPSGRRVPWPLALGLACVLVLVGWWRWASVDDDVAEPPGDAAVDTDAGAPVTSPARVRGRIVLEVIDPGELLDPDALEAGTTTGSEAAAIAETPDQRPVATAPPELGSCVIQAWRGGEPQGGPTSCDADGGFELVLPPGVHGRLAFELVVPGRLRAVIEAELPEGGIGRLPTVALGLGQRVAGIVDDGRGAVVPDVVIEARPVPDLGEAEPWRARTDAEGRFAFDTLPPGPVILRAAPAGFAVTTLDVIAPVEDVVLSLDRLYDVHGVVAGPPEAVARAQVRIEGSGVWPARSAATEAGAFVLPEIPDGVYAIEAIAAATRPGEPEYASIPLENVAPDVHVTLALALAQRVPVRVLDRSGTPIAGAHVTLGSANVGLLQRVAETDADGRAALGPIVAGGYVVRADAEGWLAAEPVQVAVDDVAPEEIVIELARPGRITGIVVDEDDRPVADARIEITSDGAFSLGEGKVRAAVFERSLLASGSLGVTSGPVPEIPLGDVPVADDAGRDEVTSDADGRFELAGLVPARYRLQARHGRYARSDAVEVQLGAGAVVSGIRLRLRTGQRLTGRVLDGNLRPLATAWITVDDGSTYATDDRGLFDLGLRRGAVELVVRALEMVPHTETVRVGDAPVDVEIVMADADGHVRGHVVDDNLRPLADARVTLRSRASLAATEVRWTDERGAFRFDGVPEGEVELEVSHDGHADASARAEATPARTGDEVEIVLRTGWELVVDVRDRDTSRAIAGARVIVDGARQVLGTDGRARVRGLSADTVEVVVEADDYAAVSTEVRRGTDDREELTIALVQGGSVAGIVTDWRGDPVAGATLELRQGDAVVATVRSDARGRFTASGIPEGDVVVAATPPDDRAEDLAPVAERIDVLRGRTTRGVDIRFERG